MLVVNREIFCKESAKGLLIGCTIFIFQVVGSDVVLYIELMRFDVKIKLLLNFDTLFFLANYLIVF